MAGDDSSKLKSLIQKAVMLSDKEREAFLDSACKEDISLRRRVEGVLASIDDPLTAISNTPQAWGLPVSGSRIGKYTIIEKLGGGGMGVVYRAEDSRLKRHVALKFLAPELTRDDDARDRFVQEAQAASALDHSNICTVYEIDETPKGLTYISMACYEGETLKKRLEEGPFSVEKAIDLAVQISNGLARAHERGIVHRDIKPANIMIVQDGAKDVIKILDFGLAKVADVSITRTGSTLGTIAYMSPEQAQGSTVDHRTDIWSLGVVFYEMLTGKRPFAGAFEQAIMYSIFHEVHTPLREYDEAFPSYLEDVIEKVLQKDPGNRFQTIEDFADALLTKEKLNSEPLAPVSQPIERTTQKKQIKWKWALPASILGALLIGALFLIGPTFISSFSETIPEAQRQQITFAENVYFPTLSPDGNFIAYLAQKGDSLGDIYIQDLFGGNPLYVHSVPRSRSIIDPIFQWSPSGTKLAIKANIDNQTGIHVVPRLGGDRQFIPMGTDHFFHWSPDGSKLCIAEIDGDIKIVDLLNQRNGTEFRFREDGWTVLKGVHWSPDGNRLAIITDVDEEPYSAALWSIEIDGTEQHLLHRSEQDLYSPKWIGDSEGVYVLEGNSSDRYDLMKIRVSKRTGKSTGQPKRVQENIPSTFFSISEDNSSLVYSDTRYFNNLWLYDIENSTTAFQVTPQALTTGSAGISAPRISSDNQFIAFSMQNVNGYDLYTMPIKGGEMDQHTFGGNGGWGSVAWNNEDTHVAFVSEIEGIFRVEQVELSNGKTTVFEKSTPGGSKDLRWGPGDNILYQLAGNRNFSVLSPETGEEHPLIPNDTIGWMLNLAYSPDGDKIAAYWNRRPERGVWLLSQTIEEAQRLVPVENGQAINPIRWSDDGQFIYAIRGGTLLRVHAITGEVEHLITVPEMTVWGADVTSDGAYLVMTKDEYKGDAWLIKNFDPEVRSR